ncbi:hAT transposon superfamily protein [Tanacetum coccineum]
MGDNEGEMRDKMLSIEHGGDDGGLELFFPVSLLGTPLPVLGELGFLVDDDALVIVNVSDVADRIVVVVGKYQGVRLSLQLNQSLMIMMQNMNVKHQRCEVRIVQIWTRSGFNGDQRILEVYAGCRNLVDALDKERTYCIHQYCARWIYESGIPFHSIDNDGFKKFVEAVGQYGRGQFIFEYVDKGIKDVGPQNVIQVVTDNATNNMAAAQLLVTKKPNIFWTSCAAHTIDLMLEAIGKEDQSIKDDVMVSNAVFAFLEKFFHHDFEKQDQVMNIELLQYKGKEGDFGRMLAAKDCLENNGSYDPGTWWMNYGNKTLILQKMAIKILSLTTSSFGCERNWNVFEGIHSKKRNWLDLVYVQFNAKLINKWARVKNKNIDILRSFDASKAQSWIINISDDEEIEEDGSLGIGGDAVGVDRKLHEDDFVLDEEQVEGGENFEFNSDEEGFI